MNSHPRKALLVLITSLAMTCGNAEEMNFGTDVPSPDKIIDYFKPPADGSGADKFRGLNIIKDNHRQHHQHKPVTPMPQEKAISMEILFGFDSDALTEKGKEQLLPVGKALTSEELKGLHYIIEGHTDIIGTDGYNLDLSRRRAETVKAFLMRQFDLSASAMRIEGKGKKDLADSNDPTSEVNRRVRIVLIN